MTQPATFGRRQTPSAPALQQRPVAKPTLSPAAEAFRADLATSGGPPSDFAAWRSAQTPRRLLAWLATAGLLLPGLICMGAKTPWEVSGAVEVAGMAASWWLRRERRRHIAAIASWDAETTKP